MNYIPIIFFREVRNHELELMKNAESILKELGFKIKTSSPHLDDRTWQIEFSDDGAKEIYIEFRDDANELHSPIVIIDKILTDQIETINGDGAYYTERIIDEKTLVDTIENESYESIKQIIPNISEEEVQILKERLKKGTHYLIDELSSIGMLKQTNKSNMNDVKKSVDKIYQDSGIYTKEALLNDLEELDMTDDDSGNQVIDCLLNYINDPEIFEYINNKIEELDFDDDDDDDDDDDILGV